MKVFALADLHLTHQENKPMAKFGDHWHNYEAKIMENCHRMIGDNDILLLAGDLSWALKAGNAVEDLKYIADLPGHKVLLRGNHDYWWGTMNKNRRLAARLGLTKIYFLQTNAYRFRDEENAVIIIGTRGWLFPSDPLWKQDPDQKILDREVGRLRISVQEAEKMREPDDVLIGMTHFPPFDRFLKSSVFTEIMTNAGVTDCVYGHIHHRGSPFVLHDHMLDDVRYHLVACDQIDFSPLRVL